MPDESVDDVLAEMGRNDDMKAVIWCPDGNDYIARLEAALERERATAPVTFTHVVGATHELDRARAALLKVADEIERGEWSIERGGDDRTPLACRRAWAAELRKAVGK